MSDSPQPQRRSHRHHRRPVEPDAPHAKVATEDELPAAPGTATHRHERSRQHHSHGHLIHYNVALVKCRSCGYMNSLQYTRQAPVTRDEWEALRCEKCGRKVAALGMWGYGALRLRCVMDTCRRRAKRWRRRVRRLRRGRSE